MAVASQHAGEEATIAFLPRDGMHLNPLICETKTKGEESVTADDIAASVG
ncbi:hypothetical protein Acor_81570 [Acrocarpospora corrugata]|uniref:Uncharacterized protein n=1 Tax=Acrocarpospora corrugata TaxID=35763 RepID=A0A5M3WIA4_9ACTN|nr:hypothetical protein Acor_81570 [Acrocarpospora corrugata]